jgi:ribosome biogenesis protein Tsr3
MPNAFAFSKIFVAVLTASQLIGAAQAASVVINQSQSEAVSISENATASYYGAFTVDSSWHDGYNGIANPFL